MSTDVTRGPRICPSCGRENAPTSAHCSFCSTSLDQGVQSTPAPRPPVVFAEPSVFRLPNSAPLTWIAAFALALLVAVSFVITFVAVCFPVGLIGVQIQGFPDGLIFLYVGIPVGLLAGGFVAYLFVRAMFPPINPRNSGGPRPFVSDED